MTDDLENQETVTIADLLDKHIRTHEDMMSVLRTQWIHQIFLQLISARLDAGITQAELAHRLGRHQSAIGRLERSDDIKLSTLFDYLSATGQVPTGEIRTVSEREAFGRLTRAAGRRKQPGLLKFPAWLRQTQRAEKYGTPKADSNQGEASPRSVATPAAPGKQTPDSIAAHEESLVA